jgi:hypothetical protein
LAGQSIDGNQNTHYFHWWREGQAQLCSAATTGWKRRARIEPWRISLENFAGTALAEWAPPPLQVALNPATLSTLLESRPNSNGTVNKQLFVARLSESKKINTLLML